MIPGSNLLDMALSIIAQQQVTYYKFLSRETNEIGLIVNRYAAPATVDGSFQSVPKSLYTQYGLDFQKTYITFYASKQVLGIARDVSSDYLIFNNQQYKCESPNDWYAVDGWVGVLCVLTGAPNLAIFGLGNYNKNFGQGSFDV